MKLFVIFLIFILNSYSVLSQENITSSAKFKELYSQENFQEVWELIKDAPDNNDDVIFTKGIFLGAEFLHSNYDRCKAVLKLEKIEENSGVYARTSLNYLYEGDWVSIAALEGNRVALFHKALRLINIQSPIVHLESKKGIRSNISRAMEILHFSNELGYRKAGLRLLSLKKDYPKIYDLVFSKKNTPFEPQKIFCEIRKYQN